MKAWGRPLHFSGEPVIDQTVQRNAESRKLHRRGGCVHLPRGTLGTNPPGGQTRLQLGLSQRVVSSRPGRFPRFRTHLRSFSRRTLAPAAIAEVVRCRPLCRLH